MLSPTRRRATVESTTSFEHCRAGTPTGRAQVRARDGERGEARARGIRVAKTVRVARGDKRGSTRARDARDARMAMAMAIEGMDDRRANRRARLTMLTVR